MMDHPIVIDKLKLPDINEWLIVAALLLVVLDVVLGVANACKTGTLSSSKMREGLWHKTAYLGIWVIAYIFGTATMYADLGFGVPTVDAVSVYIILMEGLSGLENACALNPEMAGSRLLAQFKGLDEKVKGDEEDED